MINLYVHDCQHFTLNSYRKNKKLNNAMIVYYTVYNKMYSKINIYCMVLVQTFFYILLLFPDQAKILSVN